MPPGSRRFPLFALTFTLAVPFGCQPPRVEGAVRSEVATSTAMDGWAVNYPKQRKLFFMAGLYWVFYADGRDAVYRTSVDGTGWSDPTLVVADSVFGHRIGYAFDGTYLHYAHSRAYGSDDVGYRRGEPLPDGSIQWSEAEQVAYDIPDGQNAMYPDVVVDTAGAPWITFMRFSGALENGPWDAVITASSASDGTWATRGGLPFLLVEQNVTSYPHAVGAALEDGAVYWMFNRELNETYRGRLWNGTGWEDEEEVSDGRHSYGLYNIVSDGDVVHASFGYVRYRRRNPVEGWGPTRSVGAGSGHAVITLLESERVAVTWIAPDRNAILAAAIDADGVSARWTIAEELEGFGDDRLFINLNGLVNASPDYEIATVYSTGVAPVYSVKFVGVPTVY